MLRKDKTSYKEKLHSGPAGQRLTNIKIRKPEDTSNGILCQNTPFLDKVQPAQADCLYKNSVDRSISVSIAKGHTSQLLPWLGVLSKVYVNTSNVPGGSQGPHFPVSSSVSKFALGRHIAQ